MVTHSCEKCGKEFKQKSHYNTHSNKKNPCVSDNKLKSIIESVVVEKLAEINTLQNTMVPLPVPLPNTNKPHKPVPLTKPIIKWVGGKTQIIDKIIGEFPKVMNNYRETFLGGGSVLLTLLSYVKEGRIKVNGKIYAYDLNEPLIYVYKNIQSHHDALYTEIQKLIAEYNACGEGEVNRKPTDINEAKQTKENYFYWTRNRYNALTSEEKKSILGSAIFIFMNKTCFRGVFRVGPNGFNVPYGHYKNPEIINKEHMDKVHDLIQGVEFECLDFNKSLAIVEEGDFVYLDPPYAPETEKSFVGYTENGFDIDSHKALFKLIHGLTERGIKILLSNSDVELVRNAFTNEKYNTTVVSCKRSINSKNPEAKTNEVMVNNFV